MANSCCNCHRFAARAVALRRSALDRRAPRLRCSAPRTRPAATLPLWLGTTGASQVPPRPSRSAQGGWPLSVYPDQPAKLPAWRSTRPGCPLLHRSSRCSVCLSSPAPLSSQPACVSRRERQVTPPTPTVTRALADNGTISRSTSAPETPCHRPGSCATPARAGDWLAGCSGRATPDSPMQPALLSATHPFFYSVPAVFLARPTCQSRRAPLPLAVAAGSLLPASRRVPGPVAGLRRTPVCSCQHNLWSNHTILVLYVFTLLP